MTRKACWSKPPGCREEGQGRRGSRLSRGSDRPRSPPRRFGRAQVRPLEGGAAQQAARVRTPRTLAPPCCWPRRLLALSPSLPRPLLRAERRAPLPPVTDRGRWQVRGPARGRERPLRVRPLPRSAGSVQPSGMEEGRSGRGRKRAAPEPAAEASQKPPPRKTRRGEADADGAAAGSASSAREAKERKVEHAPEAAQGKRTRSAHAALAVPDEPSAAGGSRGAKEGKETKDAKDAKKEAAAGNSSKGEGKGKSRSAEKQAEGAAAQPGSAGLLLHPCCMFAVLRVGSCTRRVLLHLDQIVPRVLPCSALGKFPAIRARLRAAAATCALTLAAAYDACSSLLIDVCVGFGLCGGVGSGVGSPGNGRGPSRRPLSVIRAPPSSWFSSPDFLASISRARPVTHAASGVPSEASESLLLLLRSRPRV